MGIFSTVFKRMKSFLDIKPPKEEISKPQIEDVKFSFEKEEISKPIESIEIESEPICETAKEEVSESNSFIPFNELPQSELPKSLRKMPKSVNIDFFNKFKATLRPHQSKSILALKDKTIGQINIPTGTGKTYIQKFIQVEDMIEKTLNNQTGVYVIAAHRLALCTQLFDEVSEMALNCNVVPDMVYVGSERYNFDKINKKYRFQIENIEGEQTTSSNAILEKAKEAKKNNKHLLIVSTYHSLYKLSKLDKIDIITFDEAHTTTSDMFTENIECIKDIIHKEFFFTATRRVQGEDGGQNNTEFYGEVEFEWTPKEAIEAGEIVRPRMHLIKSSKLKDVDIDSNPTMMVYTVKDAFMKHKARVKQVSVDGKSIGAKMLVTVNGLKELHSIIDHDDFQNYCKSNGVNVFSFSSDKGETVNFLQANRQAALEKMKDLSNTEDAILFHYDILTEGIDLPAITGILLLRDLPTTKLIQNIGRGARLIVSDRIKIYNGEILPKQVDKMIKPYCWVVIPTYLKTLQDGSRLKEMIATIRDTYDVQIEEMGEDDNALADQEHHLPKVTKKDNKNSKDKKDHLYHVFEEILIEALAEKLINSEDIENEFEEVIGKVNI